MNRIKGLKKSFSMQFLKSPASTSRTNLLAAANSSNSSLIATAYVVDSVSGDANIEYRTETQAIAEEPEAMSTQATKNDDLSFENAQGNADNMNGVQVSTVMQFLAEKDYNTALKYALEIVVHPGVSRYNRGIAHLGVAKAVFAKMKTPGKLGFDRRDPKYDVEKNLTLAIESFKIVTAAVKSSGGTLEGVDNDELAKYVTEAMEMLNDIRRREAWKRGVVWEEPKGEGSGDAMDVSKKQ